MTTAVIIDALRTPGGKRNGKLKNWHAVEPLEWCRSLRNVPLSSMAMLVGHVLAMHVNKATCETRVGVMRLAYETGTSKRTVIRALAELQELGLLCLMEKGSDRGRQARASFYRLALNDDLDQLRTDYDLWLKAQEARTGARQAPDRRRDGPDDPWRDPWEDVPA